jgi:hypothetical protein
MMARCVIQRGALTFRSYAVLRTTESFILYIANWALVVGIVSGCYYLLF